MTTQSSLPIIIAANIETIDQGIEFLESLNAHIYRLEMDSPVSGNIGAHIRHLSDSYRALILGYPAQRVDFNFRRRNSEIEVELSAGLAELHSIRNWLLALDPDKNSALKITTEVTLNDTQAVSLDSSLERELIFTSSHAIHHLAQVAIMARIHGVTTCAGLGVAAATASYRREIRYTE